MIELEKRVVPASLAGNEYALTAMGPLSTEAIAWRSNSGANLWQATAATQLNLTAEDAPSRYLPLALSESSAQAIFAVAPEPGAIWAGLPGVEVAIPRPDGSLGRYEVWQIDSMDPILAAKYPSIKTYRGRGIDDPTELLAAEFTYKGFHAKVYGTQGGFSIEPSAAIANGSYYAFNDSDYVPPHGSGCQCEVCKAAASAIDGGKNDGSANGSIVETINGTFLKSFRLAVSATGEYTAQAGGTVPLGLSAVVNVLNSVNAVYERDACAHLNLIANNDLIIYTNGTTDPFTGNNLSSMVLENHLLLDVVIGADNYDVGHVFGANNLGGLAYLGVVGNPEYKGKGGSTSTSGGATSYWMTVVSSHELGHMFNAGHTFNGVSSSLTPNRSATTAWEPGAGSTIMAYGHVTAQGQGIVSISDSYFHAGSINQIVPFINSVSGIATWTATNNKLPSVGGVFNRTIPTNTPFELIGSATDADGDTLTYNWDELDLGPALSLGSADNGSSPLFRSLPPSASSTRTFPALVNLLANTTSKAEVMPTTNRALNFRLTVRDNRPGGGAVVTEDVKITTVNTGASFQVTSPNTGVSLGNLVPQTVTWNVAGTTANGINASKVDIYLSTDGGNTFPTLLASGVPNDGSEDVMFPNVTTSSARIKVKANGNFFFDVSNTNFTITNSAPYTQSIDLASSSSSNASSVAFNVTFSEDVTGVDAADFALALSGVSATTPVAVSGSGASYVVTVNGVNGNGTLGLNLVNNGTIQDSTNKTLTGTFTGQVYTIDQIAPVAGFTASLAAINDQDVGGPGLKFSATFDEPMNTAIAPSFSFPVEDPTGTLAFSSGKWIDPTHYEGTFAISDAGVELADIDVQISGGQDVAGNVHAPVTLFDLFSIDTLNPSVVSAVLVGPNLTDATTVNYTVTLSQAAPGLTTANFALAVTGGVAGASITGVSGGPLVYDVEVDAGTGNGTLRLDLVNSTGAADDAGNPITGLPFQGNVVTIDRGHAPLISNVAINNGDGQRSRVTEVTIEFDSLVTLPALPETAFQLIRQGDSQAVDLVANVSNTTFTTVTLTFNGALSESGSLADGRYTLTVLAGMISNPLGQLDGDGDGNGGDDYVLASAPAGNPGDPFVPPTNIFRLFGDIDANGFIDLLDFAQFRTAFTPGFNAAFDFDNLGSVDLADFAQFRARFGVAI